MENVKTRLLAYLKSKRISQKEFAESLGVAPSYVGAMRKSLSSQKLAKLETIYPDLNIGWLLSGGGEMIRTPQRDSMAVAGYEVPLLPVAAFAGNLSLWSRGVSREECNMVQSPVRGGDYAIPICGDSMEPDFHDGSTLVIKRIDDRAFIPWGSPLVVDTINGVLLKDLYPDDINDGYLWAKSRNPKYPPIHIPKETILGLYRVLCSLKLFPTL
ncbi:MAG: hypothetical protein NC097_04605 [Clostridium sp.]|nr:hypothetical protein [Prevotella sp.]MCM1429058.1 hypothetical protein [Clostridium sp.]MCM1475411.1 hypothetical protein [Muribaculaceae bacterium]